MKCRHCGSALSLPFLDLGRAPPSNAYLSAESLRLPETTYPLRVLVCERCWLVQTEDYAGREALFTAEYAYFSSMSSSWLEHARVYAEMVTRRFMLGASSLVVEIASNDGYLLQYFAKNGIPCLGVEPTTSTAKAARERGLDVVEDFFGVDLADQLTQSHGQADLIAANNVLAHVPDIGDFVRGFARLLKQDGVATFEFPHLLRLIDGRQFDTIYHEHYSYLSLLAVRRILSDNGLSVFDVEELTTHGGSLRVYAQRTDCGHRPTSTSVQAMLDKELQFGLASTLCYSNFQAIADNVRNEFLEFLLRAAKAGQTVAGYGAAAKGNTLLNFAGVGPDLLPFVVDRSPGKVGRYLPGSHIPIFGEAALRERRPHTVILLPWNLKTELQQQLAYVSEWGGKLAVMLPQVEVFTP
jgi:SAM-dependent methyltransferase